MMPVSGHGRYFLSMPMGKEIVCKHFKEEIGSQRQDLVRPPLPFLGIIPKNTSFYHYPKNRCVESPVLMVKVVFQPFHLRTLRILELFTNPSDEEPSRG